MLLYLYFFSPKVQVLHAFQVNFILYVKRI